MGPGASRTARASLVRSVAQATRHLSQAAAARVDAAVAALIDGRLPRARFERVVDAKVVETDPEAAARREQETATQSYARASRSTEHGMKAFTLRATAPWVIRFDATVAYLADALAALGDGDNDDARRVKACLIMANPTHAVQLLAAFAAHRAASPPANAEDTSAKEPDAATLAALRPLRPLRPFRPGRPVPDLPQLACWGGYRFAPEKLLPAISVYLHLSRTSWCATPTGWPASRAATRSPTSSSAATSPPYQRFTITGVIDLATLGPADCYELPATHRTAVKILSPADAFPFATTLAGETRPGFDTDHNRPYQPDGPPGQSRLDNYAPLARFHHRIKTFGAWTVRQPFPGLWVWRDPHGQHYPVDHTGTRKLGRTPDDQHAAQRAGPPAERPEPRAHRPDLGTQIWDTTLRSPAVEYTFAHAG